MERACSIICFVAGTVFLVLAILGLWRHLFTMSICYAAGIMAKEDKPTE